jgi:predicted ester cyclase
MALRDAGCETEHGRFWQMNGKHRRGSLRTGPHSDKERSPMVTKQKAREVILRWIGIMNTGDLSAVDQGMDEILTTDYVWHFPGVTDLPPGPTGMRQVARGILADNPGFRGELEDLVVERDRAAWRSTWRRTDPATGKPQRLTGIVISRFVGDKIAEEWELISPWEDDA